MKQNILVTIFLTLFICACAISDSRSKNDWLANAQKYSPASNAEKPQNELPSEGGNAHSHSGRR